MHSTCLGCKTTNRSKLASGVVIRHVVFVRNHDVAVGSIGEGVAVGLVQVAGASSVTSGVVREVAEVGWACGGGCPARLQGDASRVGGIAINRVAVCGISNQLASAWGLGVRDTVAGDLEGKIT